MRFTAWHCLHCGQVIGAVRRNSSRIPILYVLDAPADQLNDEFDWSIKMKSGDVRCSCGHVRNWRSVAAQ